MEAWRRYVRSCRDTAGVGTRARAADVGVHPRSWLRRCDAEGWARPYEGVAIAPWVTDADAAVLAAVADAHGGAATGETARWRQGLGDRPRRFEVVIPHGKAIRTVRPDPPLPHASPVASVEEERRRHAALRQSVHEERRWHARCRRVTVRRCRWLCDHDVQTIGGVPVLTPEATALALTSTCPEEVRAYLIDARQAGKLSLRELGARLGSVGPIRGHHILTEALSELQERRPESVFHDDVLTVMQRLGYRPTAHPIHIPTPRGRGLFPDIPLELWQVALELEGDRYHRDRAARRRERDRLSAYASTNWVPLLVDYHTWTRAQEQVIADVDAAIETQRARGIGTQVLPPRRANSSSSPPSG